MRFVARTGPGTLELVYMWLPTFMGLDPTFKKAVDDALQEKLVGQELTETLLDWAHEQVIDLACQKYKLKGLRTWLDAVKYIEGPED